MPTHYQAASEPGHFSKRFGLAFAPEASLVRRPRADPFGNGVIHAPLARFEIARGRWGLTPLLSKNGEDLFTCEACSETASIERDCHQPWKYGYRCVILADAVFQSGAEAGVTVRVSRTNGQPLALAGLWSGWRSPAGECIESFALLTLNAPTPHEQRRTAILRDAWIDDWLYCAVEETAAYLRPYADGQLRRDVLRAERSACGA